MYNKGIVGETEKLLREKPRARETLAKVIGYAQVLCALDGTVTMKEAAEETKKETRRFARRQMIWLRRMGGVAWFNMDGSTADEVADALAGYFEAARGNGR